MNAVYFIFNWRTITLQYCDGFCHTSMAETISHKYTYVPSLINLPPTSLSIHPSRLSQSISFGSLCHITNSHWLSMLHMALYMFQCYSLKSSPLLPLQLCPNICSLCLHLHCCPISVSSFEDYFLRERFYYF